MTVLAVVCALCVGLDVTSSDIVVTRQGWVGGHLATIPSTHELRHAPRAPVASEIATRLALAGPLSIVVTLAALWAIPRLKSRRENEPPVRYNVSHLPNEKSSTKDFS
jgi:hypothetical protein